MTFEIKKYQTFIIQNPENEESTITVDTDETGGVQISDVRGNRIALSLENLSILEEVFKNSLTQDNTEYDDESVEHLFSVYIVDGNHRWALLPGYASDNPPSTKYFQRSADLSDPQLFFCYNAKARTTDSPVAVFKTKKEAMQWCLT